MGRVWLGIRKETVVVVLNRENMEDRIPEFHG